MMLAAGQSASEPSLVLGIVALLLAGVGLVAVGHWLLRRLGDLASQWARHGPRHGERWIVSADTPPPPVEPKPPATPPRAAAHQQSPGRSPGSAASEPEAAQPQAGPSSAPDAGGTQAPSPASSGGGVRGDGAERAAPPPAHPGERWPRQTKEVMGKALAVSRSLAYAEKLVAVSLRELPSDRWHVEYGILIPHYRIPFLIMGETGVFIVWASAAPPNWQHLLFATQAAVEVKKLLPEYDGDVRGAYCRALAKEEVLPRLWIRPQSSGDDQHREYRAGPGAWVLDRHWLVRWLESFGPGQGVGVKDLEQLRMLALQRPTRTPVPPPGATPFIDLVPNL